jgi:hypothetical protein
MRLHPEGFSLFKQHSTPKAETGTGKLIITHGQQSDQLSPEGIARLKLDRNNVLFKKNRVTAALHGLGELLRIK